MKVSPFNLVLIWIEVNKTWEIPQINQYLIRIVIIHI